MTQPTHDVDAVIMHYDGKTPDLVAMNRVLKNEIEAVGLTPCRNGTMSFNYGVITPEIVLEIPKSIRHFLDLFVHVPITGADRFFINRQLFLDLFKAPGGAKQWRKYRAAMRDFFVWSKSKMVRAVTRRSLENVYGVHNWYKHAGESKPFEEKIEREVARVLAIKARKFGLSSLSREKRLATAATAKYSMKAASNKK